MGWELLWFELINGNRVLSFTVIVVLFLFIVLWLSQVFKYIESIRLVRVDDVSNVLVFIRGIEVRFKWTFLSEETFLLLEDNLNDEGDCNRVKRIKII